jgi:anaerobic selenocysteine-containing dehydrogenase
MATETIHTYCPMCVAQCGVVAIVEDGRLTKIKPDSDHPNGGICIKGSAAPEVVYSADRLRQPMKRTRPKGDPDPGWVEISWEEALSTIASRLLQIKAQSGPEAVVFACATPSGGASADFTMWLTRLGHAFGTPNRLSAIHICTWNVSAGAKHSYGTPTPSPDYENTRCILLWGANPRATYPTAAQRISRARARGAKLIVIDPRRHNLARSADHWLRVRPGSDAALALAMIHVLIEEKLFDEAFVREWTTGPFLVRDDTQRLLTTLDLSPSGSAETFVVWDDARSTTVAYHPDRGFSESVQPALTGSFACRLANGASVICRPAFALLAERAAHYAPERSQEITWVPADDVRAAARLFATERPSCYFSWTGLEMHSNAMQTNRAVCCLYVLTGQHDERGSNVLTAVTPSRPVEGPHLLPKEKAAIRLGIKEHPLGPPNDPGHVQAGTVYDAILTGQPYKVRAMVCFGSDPLLNQGDVERGARALTALEFYVHMDLFANPSASFADLLLPAATGWEAEALKTGFSGAGAKGVSEEASRWAQMRKAVIPPPPSARSDLAVIFDLACRLGLGEHFFDGDIENAWRYQLEPSGLTLEQLRAHPRGVEAASVTTHYRKYAGIDPQSARPRGFPTPSRRLELYSTRFAGAGYDPLPCHEEPAETPLGETDGALPLILTSFRTVQFVNEQHRNIPRLRNEVREPFIEIHPDTASGVGVGDGEWATVETAAAKVRLRAKFNDALHPQVVCAHYGWWQACRELSLPHYDALSPEGANVNLLVCDRLIDPISASVPHRSGMCRVSKAV